MAQSDLTIQNQSFPSFRADLNDALTALNSMQSGTSRPASAVAGTMWLDTTNATNPTIKFFDGTDDIQFATVNYSANTIDFLDSSLSTPITVTGSSSAGAEIRLPEDTDNGTNYVALKAPDSISSDVTFTLPSADGTADQILKTDGSGNLSFATVSGGFAWQSVQTTGFTAVKGEAYPCDTTSAGFTVTLPATPSAGDQVQLVDYAGTFDTDALIIDPNGENIEGGTDNLQLSGEREGVILTYIDSTQGWIATSGINEGTDALEEVPYSVDFLVIAGGGGGGNQNGWAGGGGGAGGYRNSYSTEASGGGGSSEASLTFVPGTVYTVTVGAGGAAATSGVDSSISGTGISTITSTGGGKGGGNSAGTIGGSGGAGGEGFAGAAGTANQGFAGGTGLSVPSNFIGGGGGGASAVGVTPTVTTKANGGAGLASSITGSSISRGGGGGGAANIGASSFFGDGGVGGGGRGTVDDSDLAVAGTANTGGGGGGGYGSASDPAKAGGSGVVILRMPTASYSGTTTGSPTVTTDGSDTVVVFNSSGSITG
jgi:hypothetical protein